MAKEVNSQLRALQKGKIHRGWAWINKIQTQQATTAMELAAQENKLAQMLLERKKVQAQITDIEHSNQYAARNAEARQQQLEISYARAELQFKLDKADFEKREKELK